MKGVGLERVVGSVEVEVLSSFSFSLYLDWEITESVGLFLEVSGIIIGLSASFPFWEMDLVEGWEMVGELLSQLRMVEEIQ